MKKKAKARRRKLRPLVVSEGFEALPSAYIDVKPTGTFWGVKVYDVDARKAVKMVRELYGEVQQFVNEQQKGKVQS